MSPRAFCLLLLIVSAVSMAAWGQVDPAPTPRHESHGWIATPVLGGAGAAALLHFPPRASSAGIRGADTGVARQIQTLAQLPSHTASWGRRVYLLYAQTGEILDVFSVRVSPTTVPAFWAADPIVGASAELSLRLGGARVVDAAGTAAGLALLACDDRWRLWVLTGTEWAAIEMPPGLAATEESWARFVSGSAQVSLVAHYEGRTVRWALTDAGAWEPTPLADAGRWQERAVRACFASAGDVCVAVDTGHPGLEVWSLGPSLEGRVASISLRGAPVGVTPLEEGARLAVLALVRDEEAQARLEPIEQWELVELSMSSGRELYRGAPRSGAPITGSDVRWLSLGMVAVVVAILFYLLRPGQSAAAVTLPESRALAEPGRRIAAGLLDWALVGAGASLVLGVPLRQALLVMPLLESAHGVLLLVSILGAGAAYGTICEWLWGRTVGKTLAGCEVVSVVAGRARPGLMRSGARNVFKWALAPWALLGLASEDGRHRGDHVAGAAVVIRVEREESGPEPGP